MGPRAIVIILLQASSLNVLNNIEKREKKEVMTKLHEMEDELKV